MTTSIVLYHEESDWHSLETFANEWGQDFWQNDQLRSSAGLDTCRIWMALVNGTLAGMIHCTLVEELAEINYLFVKKEYRGLGLGEKLVHHLLQEAKAGSKVFLEVRPSNEHALKIYFTLGFCQDGKRLRYYRDGEDALILSKSVPKNAR